MSLMETRVDQLLSSADNYLDKIRCDARKCSRPFKCAIPTCQNKFLNFEDHQTSPFKFHDFPKIPSIAAKWKSICRIPRSTPVNTLKICSAHFSVDDYNRNFKAEFLNPSLKRTLRDQAVPTCFVGPLDSLEFSEEELEEEAVIKCEDEGNDNDISPVFESSVKSTTTVNIALKDELALLNKQIKSAENKLSKKKKILEQKKNILASVKNSLAKVKRESKLNVGKNLSSFLSKAQIDILKGKKKVYWSDDDLANAFSLRHMGGKDFYLYLKNTLNYPLPALSCVQIWAGN